jgi:hypothetical protein
MILFIPKIFFINSIQEYLFNILGFGNEIILRILYNFKYYNFVSNVFMEVSYSYYNSYFDTLIYPTKKIESGICFTGSALYMPCFPFQQTISDMQWHRLFSISC